MADTTSIEKTASELPAKASAAAQPADDASALAPLVDRVEAKLPQTVEKLSKDVQALPQAVEKAPADLAKLPQRVVSALPGELAPVEAYIEAKVPIMEALPLPDLFYGGGVLVAVVILQAIGLRLLTGRFDKRAKIIEQRPAWWSVDLLLGFTVFRMLALHLGSIVIWSAALVYGGIIPGWVPAARFAALSYTTIGSGLELSAEWHMLAPIIAISGMFTFAWTASVLVTIVSQCNHLRGIVREARQVRRKALRKSAAATAGKPAEPSTASE
ncbi:hypothetical protein [Candidatus Accumulibacter sp. ACC003]|uniref:hypothetical protein n=1 Tax=Candidatus Accumulibacter sp. ACC003 TaxID=2823334 RepID=UPI0025BC41AD|nr:hypothetical protein [Candidatus Accumulibacter sp. ACC003]